MIFLFYISASSLLIEVFPTCTSILAPPPYLFLSSLFTPASPMPMVEEGVVIIALVIPDGHIVREYPPENCLRCSKTHS